MRASIIAALLVLGSVEVFAGGQEPFFHVSICSFEATDIVVVTPGTKAEFQVLETINGDLQPGETLILSELYRPDDVSAFTKRRDEPGIWADPPPPMQPGDRVIVFLLRPGAHYLSEFQPEPSSLDGWRSANSWYADMRFSAVWLRNGEAFAFFPLGSPGPSEFHDLNVTEQEFRVQIAKGVQLRASLDQALTLPSDSMGRALQLAELVRSDDPIAPAVAFKYLKDGSAASAEVLRELLSDPKLVN